MWSTTLEEGNTQVVMFADHMNHGPGTILEEGARANVGEQLDAPVAIESILEDAYVDEWWVNLSYML